MKSSRRRSEEKRRSEEPAAWSISETGNEQPRQSGESSTAEGDEERRTGKREHVRNKEERGERDEGWKEIERAEKNDEEGNRIYAMLKNEYYEKYMPAPDADPHGTTPHKHEIKENAYCTSTNNQKDNLSVNLDEKLRSTEGIT